MALEVFNEKSLSACMPLRAGNCLYRQEYDVLPIIRIISPTHKRAEKTSCGALILLQKVDPQCLLSDLIILVYFKDIRVYKRYF
jgi:hypothetical protein